MKGAAFVKKEGLKQKALEIGRVPTHLKLEIEDYGGDDKRAYFCWTDPQDENIGIIVELGPDGELESLSRDIEPESGERLSEEKLEDIMRNLSRLIIRGHSLPLFVKKMIVHTAIK